jgi:hypothetical protein
LSPFFTKMVTFALRAERYGPVAGHVAPVAPLDATGLAVSDMVMTP